MAQAGSFISADLPKKPLSASALEDGMHRRSAISLNNLGNLDYLSKVIHLKFNHANYVAIEMLLNVCKGSPIHPSHFAEKPVRPSPAPTAMSKSAISLHAHSFRHSKQSGGSHLLLNFWSPQRHSRQTLKVLVE